MGALRSLTILLGFLIALGCSPRAAVAAPMTAAKAQSTLDALPAGAAYRDQAVYAATKAELEKKVEEARQFPQRADAILKDIYFDAIRFSPIGGYDPTTNARTAAALECYIEIASAVADPAATAKTGAPAATGAGQIGRRAGSSHRRRNRQERHFQRRHRHRQILSREH
jgi:hypothetical protein